MGFRGGLYNAILLITILSREHPIKLNRVTTPSWILKTCGSKTFDVLDNKGGGFGVFFVFFFFWLVLMIPPPPENSPVYKCRRRHFSPELSLLGSHSHLKKVGLESAGRRAS